MATPNRATNHARALGCEQAFNEAIAAAAQARDAAWALDDALAGGLAAQVRESGVLARAALILLQQALEPIETARKRLALPGYPK